VNSICHRGEPIYHHREPKNKKPSPLTRCATTICGIRVKRWRIKTKTSWRARVRARKNGGKIQVAAARPVRSVLSKSKCNKSFAFYVCKQLASG